MAPREGSGEAMTFTHAGEAVSHRSEEASCFTTISAALHYPFQTQVRPDKNLISQHSRRWVALHGLVQPGRTTARLNAIDCPGLAAHSCPRATLDVAKLIADWIAWLYVVDDIFDEQGPKGNHDGLQGMVEGLYRTYVGHPIKVGRPPDRAALHSCMRDLRQRTALLGGEEFVQWHSKALGQFFDALVWEQMNRISGGAPDLRSYAANRIHTGAVMLMFALIEFSSPVRGVAEIWKHPQMKELSESAARLICWVNDLLSYEREEETEGMHNMIFILERHEKMSRGQAIERAIDIHNKEMDNFLQLCLAASSCSELAYAEEYVSALKDWCRGCFDWSVKSLHRYNDGAHPSSERGHLLAGKRTDAYIDRRAESTAPATTSKM